MLGRTNTGGGGGGLNFKVICNPQPSTAKENTIWIDTDRINNYYFAATQPENVVDYDVWIITGTSSSVEFNALKKNGLQVYPISAKQYVGGAWVDKVAKSYQGGEWVNWITYLYKNGNQCEKITGGWERKTYGGDVGTVTFEPDCIQIASNSKATVCVGVKNLDAQAVQNAKTMYCRIDVTKMNSGGAIRFGLMSTYSFGNTSIDSCWDVYARSTDAGEQVLKCDIGSATIKFPGVTVYDCTAKIKEIWFA